MTVPEARRLAVENRVLSDMARLAMARHEYGDLVAAVLDCIEQVVAAPFLQLAIDEGKRAGRYERLGPGTDPIWGEGVRLALRDEAPSPLLPVALPVIEWQLPAVRGWAVSVGVTLRSGRRAALTLVATDRLHLADDEAHLLDRVMQQATLVLDHALLLAQLDDLRAEDGLTGLMSHRRLLETIELEIARHRHFGRPLALILIDIDGLDAINRSYGRRYGNHVLWRLAAVLRQTARPVDTVARCGLDEFAVLLPEMIPDEAESLAGVLAERCMEVEFAGGEVRVTVAVAGMRPDEALAADDLLRRGEQALAVSKRQARAAAALKHV